MTNVGFATLTLIPAAANFSRTLGQQIAPELSQAGAAGGDLFGKSLTRAWAPLALFAGAAWLGQKAWAGLRSAVQGAADLEQSIGAIETVFKGSAPQMLDWADSAATAVGLTKNEYAELGTLIGTQLKNGGTAMDELAPKTNDLIGLGADLSSMFGGSAADAVGALSSALKGERDPIERYGVSLNQAKIDAEAAALGFEKVGGSLSSEANQAATLSLIMKQTADAHGNFARETDTLSHKQQVLNAMWADGKTRIGAALVPAISALMGVLISGLGPALTGAETGITKLVEVAGGIFSILGQGDFKPFAGLQEDSGFVDFLFDLRETVMSTAQAIGEAFGPYIPAIAEAFSSLAGPLASVLPSLSPFGVILQGLLPVLPQIASLVGQLAVTLGENLATVIPLFYGISAALFSLLQGQAAVVFPLVAAGVSALAAMWLSEVVPAVTALWAGVLPLVAVLVSQLAPIFLRLVSSSLSTAADNLGMIVAAIAPLITQIAGLLVPVIAALMPVVVTVFGVIASVVTAAMQIVQGIIQVVTGVISGNWGQVWDGIVNILSGAWNLIKSVITGALAIVASVIGAALNVLRAIFSAAWNGLIGVVSGAWNGITGAISSGVSSAVSFVASLPGKILSALSTLGSLLTGVGRNMMEGLIDGVKAVAGRIAEALLAPIRNSVDAVKSFLGIHSPSRLMRDEGRAWGRDVHEAVSMAYVEPSAPPPGGLAAELEKYANALTHPVPAEIVLPTTGSLRGDLDAVDFALRRTLSRR